MGRWFQDLVEAAAGRTRVGGNERRWVLGVRLLWAWCVVALSSMVAFDLLDVLWPPPREPGRIQAYYAVLRPLWLAASLAGHAFLGAGLVLQRDANRKMVFPALGCIGAYWLTRVALMGEPEMLGWSSPMLWLMMFTTIMVGVITILVARHLEAMARMFGVMPGQPSARLIGGLAVASMLFGLGSRAAFVLHAAGGAGARQVIGLVIHYGIDIALLLAVSQLLVNIHRRRAAAG